MSTGGIQKKKVMLTSVMAIIAFAINVVIGFWTSPFIVNKLGADAYGFSQLGGNFTTYMSLFTVAINSFAARYISISIQKKDYEQANKYFTSVFFANATILAIMLVPIILIVSNIESIFDISLELVPDVKLQWGILFFSWMLDLFFKVFSTATFVKARLEIDHGLTAISNVLRFVVIIILFSGFTPRLWYIGVASLVAAIFLDVAHYIVKRKIMNEVCIRLKYFDWKSLKILIVKGIWNSFNQLAAMLINGLSLLVTNIFIGDIAMGLYSVAQLIPTYLQSLMYTLCNIFTPNLTISYAKGRNDEVRDGITYAMKFNSLLLMVPLLGFLVYGFDFYTLWQNSLNPSELQTTFILSILVIFPMISSVITQPLLTVNTITARLKLPVIMNTIIGVLNIVVELILVYTTDLGVYAVAGVSAVLLTLRNYLFYPIYSAVNLSLPVKTFYPTIIKGTVCSAIIFGFLFVTHSFIEISGWIDLIIYAIIFGAISELLLFVLLLNKSERTAVLRKITRKK